MSALKSKWQGMEHKTEFKYIDSDGMGLDMTNEYLQYILACRAI